jgi:hypothetical protein
MRNLAVVVFLFIASVFPAPAQKNKTEEKPSGAKLEAILKAVELPFTKSEEDAYVAVITVEENESERFHLFLSYLGDDPKDERYQLVQMYFLLGQLPKGITVPAALAKQITVWNGNLTIGKVVIDDNVVLYTSTEWMSRVDADTLVLDATIGHYASKDLRKEVAAYVKQ